MNLHLNRKYKKAGYTIGKLYVDGTYFCDTLEDTDRGLKSTDSASTISATKVPGSTAIPTGVYTVVTNVVSTKYSNFSKYTWAKYVNGCVPRLLDVPGFDGILIHPGNTSSDTSGCILVGENKSVGTVSNSVVTWKRLVDALNGSSDTITITID